MKTSKDFRLSKADKRVLAMMPEEKRSHWKKMMIDAQVSYNRAKLAKVRDRSNNNQGEE